MVENKKNIKYRAYGFALEVIKLIDTLPNKKSLLVAWGSDIKICYQHWC